MIADFKNLLALLVILAYMLVGILFAVFTPAWQAPDEPAHYNYVRQVAENGCCPTIESGDWQQDYQNELTTARFNPELLDGLPSIQYEDHQPPLYYLLAGLIYRLTDGSLTALRIFSVLVGALAVSCAYWVADRLMPDRSGVSIGVMMLFGFLPQHMAILSAVNNDGLAEFLISLTLLATIIYLKTDQLRGKTWVLGGLVGLIFLTKSTGYFMAAVVPVAILWRWWDERRNALSKAHDHQAPSLQSLVQSLVLFLMPALFLGGIWWLRNLSVYGFPDFLGLGAHNRVVVGQMRTAEFIATSGSDAYLNRVTQDTFNSFWGQFGWMALPLQAWMYRIFQGLLLIVMSGLVVDGLWLRPRLPKTNFSRYGVWIVLLLTTLFALLAYIYYNTEFLQLQGRYLFPGLIPIALFMILGVDAWRCLLLSRLTWSQWLTPALFALLIPLDVYLLLWVIKPLLAP